MIELIAVGGYGEVGKNMTAIRIDDDVVVLDMGLHMPNYIKYTEEELGEVVKLEKRDLIRVHAIPDDSILKDWKNLVRAIIPGHAHLDHIGAVPYLAQDYTAPIICTPYTAAVLRAILKDEKIKLPNEIRTLEAGGRVQLSKNLTLEFVHVTHSVPQTVIVALHTKYGVILYTCDFKLDNHPLLGKRPNYERLKQLGEKGVVIAVIDSLYAHELKRTPSESVAREMLRDALLSVDTKGKGLFVTTFSSHIVRLRSILECAKELKRRAVILGRSLTKYILAAEDIDLVHFSKEADIARFKKQVVQKLREVDKKGRDKFLLVVTGHQGEPKSILSRIANKQLPFNFRQDDVVVFSCNVIPTPVNKAHRERLESQLHSLGVRMLKDVHVSGHAAREDMRELLNLIKAKHVVPSHSPKHVIPMFVDLAKELGYDDGKTVHTLYTGQKLRID